MTTTNQPAGQNDMLAYIHNRKSELRKEIQICNENIRNTTRTLFAPPKANNKMESFFNIIDQGMAVYDGVVLGMRVMRNFRRIFSRSRR